jgi:hypothetical protein
MVLIADRSAGFLEHVRITRRVVIHHHAKQVSPLKVHMIFGLPISVLNPGDVDKPDRGANIGCLLCIALEDSARSFVE